MGSDNGRKREESALKTQALASASRVEEVDPLEQRVRDRVLKLDRWRSGEDGPVDVRKMPGSEVALSLFRDAKESRDAGRVGRGLATLSDGASPNFAASLDREMQLERDLNASGALEDHVSETMQVLDAKMMGLSSASDSRDTAAAGIRGGMYRDFVNRPQQPSFLKQLALGGISALGQAGGRFGGGSRPPINQVGGMQQTPGYSRFIGTTIAPL